MMETYRTLCDFSANGGKTQVVGRVHFEMASNPEEAAEKSRSYLEACGYTGIIIRESRPETEREKYVKGAVWESSECHEQGHPIESSDELF